MCRALQRLGAAPLVATTNADGASQLRVPIGRETRCESVRTIFFPRQVSESFKFSWPLARWLGDATSDFDAVHIHAVFSHSSLSAARACRRAGVPYVVRPLGTLAPWSLTRKRHRKWLVWKLAGERMLRDAAAVHYTTVAERDQTERALCMGVGEVIPLGVDEALLETASDDGAFRVAHPAIGHFPYLLFLSRIDPKKRLESVIDAFADVTRDIALREWRLVVVGDGDPGYVARVRRRAAGTGIGDRIVFAGWLDGVLRASALRGAELLTLVSYQENFGLSVVEALACGVPVLVSEGVDIARDVGAARAGWVVGLDDDALRTKLRKVLVDAPQRRARGRAGRALVRSQYSWPLIGRKLMALYRSVAASAKAES